MEADPSLGNSIGRFGNVLFSSTLGLSFVSSHGALLASIATSSKDGRSSGCKSDSSNKGMEGGESHLGGFCGLSKQ